jgi:Arc/MetJ-type ribon-helix-helix transcriptional regulator
MSRITITVDKRVLAEIDRLVRDGSFATRSQAIDVAVRSGYAIQDSRAKRQNSMLRKSRLSRKRGTRTRRHPERDPSPSEPPLSERSESHGRIRGCEGNVGRDSSRPRGLKSAPWSLAIGSRA